MSEALKTNSSLTELTLGYQGLGNAGAKVMSEALKINTVLSKLDLSCFRRMKCVFVGKNVLS